MANPGLSPEVQEALQRRGMTGGSPALNQMSPQAATANPITPPATPSSLNQASAPQASQPQKFEPQSQDDIIVSALIEQLKNNGKERKEQVAMGGGKPDFISQKIPKLINEGYPQDQAAAIAYSMQRK